MLNFCDAEARRKVWRRGTQSKDSPITCYGNTRADRVRFVTTLDGHHRPQSPFSPVFSLLVKQKCIIIVHFYKVLKISSSLIFSSSKFKNVFIFFISKLLAAILSFAKQTILCIIIRRLLPPHLQLFYILFILLHMLTFSFKLSVVRKQVGQNRG